MNVSNLQTNHQKLLDYLAEKGYCKSHIQWVRKAIRAVLTDGSEPDVQSYEQLYWQEIKKWGWKENAPCRKVFKSVLCCIKAFDREGRFPSWTPQPGLSDTHTPTKYELLAASYKNAIDSYVKWAAGTTKRNHTVYAEERAAICFFTHLQSRGRTDLEAVSRNDVMTFFHDGKNAIRGHSYIGKIMPVLKHMALKPDENAVRVIGYIPRIPKAYPNYDYLKREEAMKIADTLNKEESASNLLDKAIVTLAYYTGMRGSDIASLTIASIDWEHDTITIQQSKTGEWLTLPLSATVGNAIWKYIVSRRPSEARGKRILVSNRRPFEKIGDLWYHVKNVFNDADVRTDGSRTGVRIFRHHLATALLANEVATPVISSILGHTCPESIDPYVDADIEHLRECALSIEEFPIAEEVLAL